MSGFLKMQSSEKRAVVTGITGQDGAYLSQLLLEKGYRVYGAYRRTSSRDFWRLDEIRISSHPNLRLVECDLTDLSSIIRLLEVSAPNEVYNLAAQSFVGTSFEQPITTAEITAIGTLNILEAIRIADPGIRFYQASTSEMYGKVQAIPQNETTPFYPRSPYGVAKLFAHWTAINYWEAHGIYAASGILFNHESPLRGREFVTRKITDGLARIQLGLQTNIELGNLEAKRDWGFAAEYVEGMWRMLQSEYPGTYVLATGNTHTVREFVQMAAHCIDLDIEFHGSGQHQVGVDTKSGKVIVSVNPDYYRPAEVDVLKGDASKALKELGWSPKTDLQSLAALMMEADLNRLQSNK